VGKRDFGTLRRLPSGRWQARYRTLDGSLATAPATFDTRALGAAFLAQVQADRSRGVLVDPRAGSVPFGEYAASWLAQRADLRPRTVELYNGLLRRHLLPHFARTPIDRITPGEVRRWHAARIASGLGRSTVAKAYRLLKTILNTAVADELLVRNPCVLRGAGAERTPERRPPTLAEVEALATAIAPRWRMLVVLAAWSGLRWGELVGLTRRRVDLLHGTLTVVEQLVEPDAGVFLGPPKTDAGRRVVHLPPHLLPELSAHLDAWVGAAPDAWVFCGPKGAPLVRSNFTHHWSAARRAAGLPGLHFHDLRHLAATLAATTGATTKELMARMGHSSPRAALIYQHAAADRDQAIAEALSALVRPVEPVQLRPGL